MPTSQYARRMDGGSESRLTTRGLNTWYSRPPSLTGQRTGTRNGTTYDFGTTGNVRRSDLVMWDRQTESWWQQLTGQGIVGALAGAH